MEYMRYISPEKGAVGNSEVQWATRVFPLPFPKIIRSWTRMLSMRPYFLWYRLIRRYLLKCYKDRWRRGMVSRPRTRRYGLPSKRPLQRFMAIGKSRIVSFHDGCKLCRCLCQVPSSNWLLSHIITRIFLIGAMWCSIVYSGHFSLA